MSAAARTKRDGGGRIGPRPFAAPASKRERGRPPSCNQLFTIEDVAAAVRSALSLSAISFDAVKQLVLARIERRTIKLDLTAYPHLPRAEVRATRAADYLTLTTARAA